MLISKVGKSFRRSSVQRFFALWQRKNVGAVNADRSDRFPGSIGETGLFVMLGNA